MSCEVKKGQATDAQLKEGLQAAAKGMSAAYAELLKTYPQLSGNVRGDLRIRSDGSVLNFADIHSQFKPALPQGPFADFLGAGFGPNCSFPPIDNVLILSVDFRLEPNS